MTGVLLEQLQHAPFCYTVSFLAMHLAAHEHRYRLNGETSYASAVPWID